MTAKIALSWSGGKDATLALYHLLQNDQYEIDHLHTIINLEHKRVGMHGISETLIMKQAEYLNLPLHITYLASDSSHGSYGKLMDNYITFCKSKNIEFVAFGDIFLEDLKAYREEKMLGTGIKCLFPLWGKDTKTVITEFLDLGFKTKICAGDSFHFDKEQIGRTIDEQWINNLSPTVDPCGENGEFHTFVIDGPLFEKPIPITWKENISKTYHFKIKEDNQTLEKTSTFYFAEFE